MGGGERTGQVSGPSRQAHSIQTVMANGGQGRGLAQAPEGTRAFPSRPVLGPGLGRHPPHLSSLAGRLPRVWAEAAASPEQRKTRKLPPSLRQDGRRRRRAGLLCVSLATASPPPRLPPPLRKSRPLRVAVAREQRRKGRGQGPGRGGGGSGRRGRLGVRGSGGRPSRRQVSAGARVGLSPSLSRPSPPLPRCGLQPPAVGGSARRPFPSPGLSRQVKIPVGLRPSLGDGGGR